MLVTRVGSPGVCLALARGNQFLWVDWEGATVPTSSRAGSPSFAAGQKHLVPRPP